MDEIDIKVTFFTGNLKTIAEGLLKIGTTRMFQKH